MKNIKEITLSVLIIILFYTVLTSVFEDKPQVWEITANQKSAFSVNKVTGEVRFHYYSNKKLITLK